jgi:hypothetical protein
MPRILPPDSAGSSKGSGSRDLYPVSRKGFLPPLSMDTSEAGFEFKVVNTVYNEKNSSLVTFINLRHTPFCLRLMYMLNV